MSICMYARISKKCIDEDVLARILTEYFFSIKNIIIPRDKKYVTYEDLFEDDNIVISFISERKPPYNVYDSSLYNGEFEYTQVLIFDIKKEEASIDKYKKILDFCIYLKKNIEGDILVTSDVHNEICLLRKDDIIVKQELFFD